MGRGCCNAMNARQEKNTDYLTEERKRSRGYKNIEKKRGSGEERWQKKRETFNCVFEYEQILWINRAES